MKKTTTLFQVVLTVFLLVVFLMGTASAQLSSENLSRAPFISAVNSHHDLQSIMQNSEKDIVFIENIGQIRDTDGKDRPDVLFLTRSQGVDIYITNSGVTYVFRKTEGEPKSDNFKTSYHRLDMEFIGMNKNIKIKKEITVKQKFNYYTPEYPNGISPKAFKKVTIENLYEGIDIVYYEKKGKMKYDFIVKAGANPENIRIKFRGASTVYINEQGKLVVTTPLGEIRDDKPFTYTRNTGKKIESSYEVNGKQVQFSIADYDKSNDIIIDPYRIWATYYGGSNGECGYSICEDNSGNIYVSGYAQSNFPIHTLTGAYNQSTHGGLNDAFILKFNSSGVRLWATYYGGSDNDEGKSICTDNSGNLYVTGRTKSYNFPTQTLTGAYNQSFSGGLWDAFILKFNSRGARLWATHYGGTRDDAGNSINIDNSGNLYVIGESKGALPIQFLPGAYNQTTPGSGSFYDAFILKFNSSGARLWATYYGGNNDDFGNNICIDNSNNLYVIGYTWSTNFPLQTLTGAYNQATFGGIVDLFILKFNSSGARSWATYYGGNFNDKPENICTDASDNLYITGSAPQNFPIQTLPGAYNQTTNGGYDAFILKFNSSGARLWATYYGGNLVDVGHSICTDALGNLFVSGSTESNNFPTMTLPGAYNQTTKSGNYDAFILKFNSSGARLWATYYGGNSKDISYSIYIGNTGNLFVSGSTESNNFPTMTLAGAYNQTTFGGSQDAFVLKFNPSPSMIKIISNEIPMKYSLFQNYPNPFNPIANIKFEIPKSTFVKIIIYNALGKAVTTLVNEKLIAGSYKVDWNGSDYPSGVYLYKLITDGFIDVKKMVLVK